MPSPEPPRPLDGVRVLDLSRVLSGPFAGRVLADLGADVVKVEPPDGDVTRLWGRQVAGLSGFFTQQNVGKRNVCIDLKAPGASDLVVRLASAADVLIENYRPGVLARLGVGFDRLQAANPRLVILSISGYGQTGPDRDRQAYAPVVQAEAGLVERQARADGRPPVDPVLSIADTHAGLHGLVGVLSALLLRERTGLGQHLDISMLESVLVTDDYVHNAVDDQPLLRLGGEAWETAGGPIMVAGQFKNTWHQLHTTVPLADPTPAGADLPLKIASRREAVRAWFASFEDRDAVKAALATADLAYGDIRTSHEAVRSATAEHRGIVVQVDDRAGGTRGVPDTPYRFSAATSGVRGPAAHRGEHNAAVLADWLGAPAAEVEALVAAGVLGSDGRAETTEGSAFAVTPPP